MTEAQTLFLPLSSLVAMLEAFVYDPLISWRLLDQSTDEVGKEFSGTKSHEEVVGGTITSLPLDAHNVTVTHPVLPESIQEEQDEDGEDDDDDDDEGDDDEDQGSKGEIENGGNTETNLGSSISNKSAGLPLPADASSLGALTAPKPSITSGTPYSTSHAKSLQMYSEMRALAANLSTSSRIASVTGSPSDADGIFGSTTARSRIDKSIRQREKLLSVVDGEGSSAANENALNERALKVIRRVQDKLTGTDFHKLSEELAEEPLDVQEQVQRLIVQATSSENLCQLFIGWCAFW